MWRVPARFGHVCPLCYKARAHTGGPFLVCPYLSMPLDEIVDPGAFWKGFAPDRQSSPISKPLATASPS